MRHQRLLAISTDSIRILPKAEIATCSLLPRGRGVAPVFGDLVRAVALALDNGHTADNTAALATRPGTTSPASKGFFSLRSVAVSLSLG